MRILLLLSPLLFVLRASHSDPGSSDQEELISITRHHPPASYNAWRSVRDLIDTLPRHHHHRRHGSNEEPALSCQLASVQGLKAVISLSSLIIILHLVTDFKEVCDSSVDVLMLLLVVIFGSGIAETLLSIIGVCTSCAHRVHAEEGEEGGAGYKMKGAIDALGALGIVLGMVKTAGTMRYLTGHEVEPVCDGHNDPAGLLALPVVLQVLVPSLLQLLTVILALALAALLDR